MMNPIGYLINVAIAASSYWLVAVVFFVGYLVLKNKLKKPDPARRESSTKLLEDFSAAFKFISLAFLVIGLFVGLTSSSNTWRNSTDYNKEQDLRQIERIDQNNSERPLVIQDISRQPQTVEERAANSVDMRERVTPVTPNQ